MRWSPGGRSPNLEDRRGRGMGGPIGIGGGLITLILALIFGPQILSNGPDQTTTSSGEVAPSDSAGQEAMVQFVSFIIDDVQNSWTSEFDHLGEPYTPAKLVLFRDGTESGCGLAQSAMGPFYCPVDQKVYLDLGFFDELNQNYGAPGDFAQAYVIAHEFGHHVQKLLGTEGRVRRMQAQQPALANQLSVRLELQADCYAGVWGHSAASRGELEPGDVEEGLRAASAVGDDRIQRATTGRVNVDSFTHGSAAQRSSWFRRGFQRGDPQSCDTFAQ